jgi:hypothetical protein
LGKINMQFGKLVLRAALAATPGLMFCAGQALAAAAVQPPFDAKYSLYSVASGPGADPVPGIPSAYAAIGFKPGDSNTLLMGGASYNNSAAIYSIGVTRDANGHINGFTGAGTQVATAPGRPGNGRGIGYGPAFSSGGVLFYDSPDNSLSMLKPGSAAPDKQIDLGTLALSSAGPVAIVPPYYPGAGRIKLVQTTGEFYDGTLQADGSGTFNVGALGLAGKLAVSANNVITGIVYVAPGNDQFSQPGVLSTSCDYNTGAGSNLVAYQLDSNGSVVASTPRTVVTGLCALGVAADPVTGDLLFTNYYGYPALTVLTGFTVPQPPPVPPAPASLFEAPGDGQARLCWDRPAGVLRNSVYQVASAGGASPVLVQKGVGGGCTMLTGLSNGSTYYYEVTATNDAGESQPSAVVTVTLAPTPVAVPPAPGGLSIFPGNGSVEVCWNRVASAYSYNLYRVAGPGGASPSLAQSGIGGGCGFATGLSNGTAYYFEVTSANKAGEGSPSVVIGATPH